MNLPTTLPGLIAALAIDAVYTAAFLLLFVPVMAIMRWLAQLIGG